MIVFFFFCLSFLEKELVSQVDNIHIYIYSFGVDKLYYWCYFSWFVGLIVNAKELLKSVCVLLKYLPLMVSCAVFASVFLSLSRCSAANRYHTGLQVLEIWCWKLYSRKSGAYRDSSSVSWASNWMWMQSHQRNWLSCCENVSILKTLFINFPSLFVSMSLIIFPLVRTPRHIMII